MSTDIEMTVEEDEKPSPQPTKVEYPDLITSIALFLSNKVKAHDIKFQTTRNPKTNFTSSYPPQISIDNYLFHLIRN